ncbi:hypothetical protein [Anaerobiospirillum thomasii]|uniref:Uncharacterized protein n=1 Tax=Anaerobiospirillum thomasii TaxID=179995 RepID=A0A2X0V7U0_9GAMM|nr:hypothetical protein [Anaerobiospirillum thomasii]SPT68865.1 Uncharacterised protein [Anaerobiospirillum thomasii]
MTKLSLYFKKIIAQLLRNTEKKNKIKKQIGLINKKLGVTYNVFDGTELLEASIKSIKDNVDYINIIYQEISNFGQKITEKDLCEIQRLKNEGIVDEVICYQTDFSIKPQDNETNKRNIGVQHCKKNKCTHFLLMDTDEFYRGSEFLKAKEYIMLSNIDVSACSMYFYIKEPIYRSKYYQGSYFVPFICKLSPKTKIQLGVKAFCKVDPTRLPNKFSSCYVFAPEDITMHHFSLVREDLEKKFNNSTLNQDKKYKEYMLSTYDSVINYHYPSDLEIIEPDNKKIIEIIQVPNEFNIKIKQSN